MSDSTRHGRPSRVRPTSRGRVIRWPAILLLAAALVVMAVVSGDPGARNPLLAIERDVVPTAGSASSLSSTWYCAAGTINAEGPADHTVVIANPSTTPASVRLTVYPVLAPTPIEIVVDGAQTPAGDADAAPAVVDAGQPAPDDTADLALSPPEAIVLPTADITLEILPRSVSTTRVADLEGVTGEHAAVLVEADVGTVVVEHSLTGPSGSTAAPCSSASSNSWYFAAGTTRKGSREVLSIFNPFPGDAVIDLTFNTDAGPRTPQIYDGLVVPSGSVLPVDITDVVTLFDSVSASLQVRTGRIVTDRMLLFDGSEGLTGLSVAGGSPEAATTWVFASSPPADGVDTIVIHNPSATDPAQLDLEISLDLPEFNGRVEPVGLKILPGRTETVSLGAGISELAVGRVTDASGRLLDGVGYWVAVRSLNNVPVVADRMTLTRDAAQVQTSASPGAPVAATTHLLATFDGVGEVALVNPAADRLALLDLRVVSGGEEFTLGSLEVARQSRLVVDLAALGVPADSLLIIDSSEPVFAERRMRVGGGGLVTMSTIVGSGTTSRPELPLP